MNERKVFIKHPEFTGIRTFTTTSATLGELEEELKDVYFEGYRIVHREEKADIMGDDTPLPAEDFTLIFHPQKVKNGN